MVAAAGYSFRGPGKIKGDVAARRKREGRPLMRFVLRAGAQQVAGYDKAGD